MIDSANSNVTGLSMRPCVLSGICSSWLFVPFRRLTTLRPEAQDRMISPHNPAPPYRSPHSRLPSQDYVDTVNRTTQWERPTQLQPAFQGQLLPPHHGAVEVMETPMVQHRQPGLPSSRVAQAPLARLAPPALPPRTIPETAWMAQVSDGASSSESSVASSPAGREKHAGSWSTTPGPQADTAREETRDDERGEEGVKEEEDDETSSEWSSAHTPLSGERRRPKLPSPATRAVRRKPSLPPYA